MKASGHGSHTEPSCPSLHSGKNVNLISVVCLANVDEDSAKELEDYSSSVEDLLLNMSASAYAGNDMCNQDFSSKNNVTSAINPTYVKHVDALDAWRRREMTSVNYSSKARLMQLDGLGQKHHQRKGSVEMAFKVAQSSQENSFPVPSLKQETAFTAYRKMSPSVTPTMEVDNYAALPWHIHRAGSKVARTKRRNTASKL